LQLIAIGTSIIFTVAEGISLISGFKVVFGSIVVVAKAKAIPVVEEKR
jgi:hypothetical protein